MTVEKLIEKLRECDPKAHVFIETISDRGHIYKDPVGSVETENDTRKRTGVMRPIGERRVILT